MRLPAIAPTANAELAARLDAAINNKTKPLGSLGALEVLAKQLGLIQQTVAVSIDQPAIIVFAGDHGVVAEGISAYPQDVTWQMVENFLTNGAAINVFARQTGAALYIVAPASTTISVLAPASSTARSPTAPATSRTKRR